MCLKNTFPNFEGNFFYDFMGTFFFFDIVASALKSCIKSLLYKKFDYLVKKMFWAQNRLPVESQISM